MSAPRTARERVRDEVTKEILVVARAHLARDGGAALSLRSIARDLETAPSALYRYFEGRDALLSALILEAYSALADEAERASAAAYRGPADPAARWLAVPRAMRTWALARPHEWGLIFGSPVPGYRAPEETVAPYARIATALVRPLVDAQEHGRLAEAGDEGETPGLRSALEPVHEGLLADSSVTTVQRVLHAWATLTGVISLEVFGHWRNTVLDPALFFDVTMRDTARLLGVPI
jgi:AcrR family transcriptional regulator